MTHDTGDAARKHLASLGWDELVDVVVGLDGCGERKPSPTPVLTALRALGVPPWEAVMVGDTATDLQAGRAAGCRLSVGVLTGLGTADELSPRRPPPPRPHRPCRRRRTQLEGQDASSNYYWLPSVEGGFRP